MRTTTRLAVLSLVLLLTLSAVGCSKTEVSASESKAPGAGPVASMPDVIPLPDGFQPEGITAQGSFIFMGSIPTGAIYRAEIGSKEGTVVVAARKGRAAIGLKVDALSRIFVAGGPTGKAFGYDARTGSAKAEYTLSTAKETFINDVVIAGDAAWFTDSSNPVLYRVEIPQDDSFGNQSAVSTLKLSGDFKFQPGAFNMNGIVWTGDRLICVQSVTGLLFTVDPKTGLTTTIDLGGEKVVNGDGLLLEGRTLFVVQNQDNQVAVIDLSEDLASGKVRTAIKSPAFDVPTTVVAVGKSLYLPNARFGTEPTPATTYSVIRVDKP